VVIENLPGAGGITGTTQLVRAPKDGTVIGVVSNNHVVNPHVYKSAPFDAIEDIAPITVIGATPFVLVAHPSVQARSVRELIALAKAKPGVLNYGSSGNGTILHLGAAMYIPYRGMGPLMNDILGGQVQLGVVAVAPAGLPKAEVTRLYNGFKAALATPEASAVFFCSELARMGQVVRNANVKVD
jgi:tripartite-type tricarboxylate transporter receptor subunit TctC